MSVEPRSVLIASADRLFGDAVASFLDRRAEWRVVGTANDGLQALAAANRLEPSCVLVIGELARIGPPQLVHQIARRFPQIGVVILSERDVPGPGMLPASAASSAVLAALRSAPGYVPDTQQRAMARGVILLRGLTKRERLTLKLLAKGNTMNDIAERLGVSKHTVRTHMQNVYGKLGLHSRLDVVNFAVRHGLIDGNSARHDEQQ